MSSSSAVSEKEETLTKAVPEATTTLDDDSAATFADLHERETAQTQTLVAILKQGSPDPYAHWGINE